MKLRTSKFKFCTQIERASASLYIIIYPKGRRDENHITPYFIFMNRSNNKQYKSGRPTGNHIICDLSNDAIISDPG